VKTIGEGATWESALKWKIYMKIDLRKICCEVGEWIKMVQI
jgi:hypothetical protein